MEFWEQFEKCWQCLPERMAKVLSLRVKDGLDVKKICKLLRLTRTNIWVTLHRARARLRVCLENNGNQERSKEKDSRGST